MRSNVGGASGLQRTAAMDGDDGGAETPAIGEVDEVVGEVRLDEGISVLVLVMLEGERVEEGHGDELR